MRIIENIQKAIKNNFTAFLLRFFLLNLSLLIAIRVYFFITQNSSPFTFSDFFYSINYGARYDIAEAAYLLGLFILLCFPIYVFHLKNKLTQRLITAIITSTCTLVFFFHFIDIWYYSVMQRRVDTVFYYYCTDFNLLGSVKSEISFLKCFFEFFVFFGLWLVLFITAINKKTYKSIYNVGRNGFFFIIIVIVLLTSIWQTVPNENTESFKVIASKSTIFSFMEEIKYEKKFLKKYWEKRNKEEISYAEKAYQNVSSEDINNLRQFIGKIRYTDNNEFPLMHQTPFGEVTPILDSLRKSIGTDKPNIIIFMVESLRSIDMKTANPDNKHIMTPFIDSLAQNSLFFRRHYTTNVVTIGSILSVLASVNPFLGLALTHHPNIKNILSISDILKKHGYTTGYLKCGSIRYESVNSFLKCHSFDYIAGHENFRYDTPGTFWGTYDHWGYRKGLEWVKSRKKPCFMVMASIVNHHPWLAPDTSVCDENYGYLDSIHKPTHYYNTLRYSDWALKKAFKYAAENNLMDNSIFIVMGDHGFEIDSITASTASNVYLEASKAQSWVPLIIYSPKYIPFIKTFDIVTSHNDIPPSIMDILGIKQTTPYIGQSIFRIGCRERFATWVNPWARKPFAIFHENNVYKIDLNNNYSKTTLFPLGDSKEMSLQIKTQLESALNSFYTYNYLLSSGRIINRANYSLLLKPQNI